MKVEYESDYGADRDGNRGIPIREVSLDNSPEEREEIASKIYDALIADGEINLEKFNVILTHTERSNCRYDEEHDETFCDEIDIEFDTDICPIDYMDIVIPMAIEQVDNDWNVEDISHLLYLEKVLTETGYEGKELTQLSKVVNPFREEWEHGFLRRK